MKTRFSSIEEAVEAIARGRLVIVVDAEDRENEGDFVGAAEKVTPETVHFVISQGRGQLCVPILPATAQRLGLTPMVLSSDPSAPCFTIPVDHRRSKTGISPFERAATIQAITDRSTSQNDFVRPGHVFPLIAKEQGVLRRPGHTEATVDLVRLAGLSGAGLLCEICSRDGQHMAGIEELTEIATQFRLPLITIDALIEFRREHTAGSLEGDLLEQVATIL